MGEPGFHCCEVGCIVVICWGGCCPLLGGMIKVNENLMKKEGVLGQDGLRTEKREQQ
jgi:hypothetical protein